MRRCCIESEKLSYYNTSPHKKWSEGEQSSASQESQHQHLANHYIGSLIITSRWNELSITWDGGSERLLSITVNIN